ncbi:hypothetical protein [Macrococcus armenti]|uniref:hypothetical protein n=1 Tax=Macrococcus armenti TaxID=2875764 RepID=UPI001CC957F3|nr:hypothetical protein [Macrococcus armenti]UBH16365.1 hypothetical protein LAU44_05265 [Macrococcus armenti]UBH18721.1 hypothetical protein LAU39_05275 [Macrococcus armenti]UBH20993.1 hypothetical protein LAU40_05270 [Macrococcus armenti]
MFKKNKEVKVKESTELKMAKAVYHDEIQPTLKKDGLQHVLFVNSFGKVMNGHFSIEDKATEQIDYILTEMQNGGFEILDVQFMALAKQGALNFADAFRIMIKYKG